MGRPPLAPGTFGKILFLAQTDGRVRARVNFRDFDGRVRQVTKCRRTRAEAERALKLELVKRQAPATGGAITGATRVSELADVWLDGPHVWSPTTERTYRSVVRNLVKPAIGQLRVQEVSPGVITGALRTIADRNGPGAAKSAKACLSGMFAMAVEDGAAHADPVSSPSARSHLGGVRLGRCLSTKVAWLRCSPRVTERVRWICLTSSLGCSPGLPHRRGAGRTSRPES